MNHYYPGKGLKRHLGSPFFTHAIRNGARGFTLVELILVIVILGVIGGMVSVFMRSPIDAYFASARRSALTDLADTTVRRMARDIQRALPNSVNTSTDKNCIEFIPTKTGGRYRTSEIVAGDDKSLRFGAAETTFNMLGNNNDLPADQRIKAAAGEFDLIAVTNLGYGVGDAYTGANTAVLSNVTNGTETQLEFASVNFDVALESPSSRFQVIPSGEKVVAYVCTTDTADNTKNSLYRISSNTLAHLCPVSPSTTLPSVSGAAIIAKNVICSSPFDYSGSDLQRNALVNMRLSLKDSSGTETVTLQHEVHVSNTP
ncbi:MAG: type II secretion system GspH family protein [Rhodoferax sp.]|nr:type II secretion system GspH family protein [Rhodoferax sp.]